MLEKASSRQAEFINVITETNFFLSILTLNAYLLYIYHSQDFITGPKDAEVNRF